MKPIISVVIVTYNREKLLAKAIDSVLCQKFSGFELVIIDDSSTDNTEDLVKKYLSDERVKYIKIAKSKSISQVRNSAWPHVSGKYIAVLDSDDIWCDDLKLNKQFNFLEKNSDFVVVGSAAALINSEDQIIEYVKKPESDNEIRKDFFVKNPFFHSSVMFRLEAVKRIGGYDEKIKFGEDLDLWLRLGKEGKFYNFPEVMIKYRIHNDNEIKKHWSGAVLDVLRIIKKNRKTYNAGPLVFLKKIFRKLSEYFKSKN